MDMNQPASLEYYLNDPSADPSVVAETEIRFPLK
jgi:hypothetical protein